MADARAPRGIRSPSVSAVICTYTERRWDDLVAAVGSTLAQTRPPLEVIVVVDHNPALLARAAGELAGVLLVANGEERGLSGARNSGLALARGDVVAFLDDDAVADRDWLAHLTPPYRHDGVLGVGGTIDASWVAGRPRSFPAEFDWVVGCTYRGMPTRAGTVRNLIGANMSFRRELFDAVGTFSSCVGRVGTRPAGCEETELCLRAARHWPDGVFVHEPAARVLHRGPPERGAWRYFGSRCWAEGRSKAAVAGMAGTRRGLASERSYALRALPAGVARGVADAVRLRDPAGIGRGAAIAAGLVLTTGGYVTGRASAGLTRAAGDHETRRSTMTATLDRRTPAGSRRPERDRWLLFDLHGRLGMRVDAGAPTAAQLADMFAPFRTDRLARVDLTVTAGAGELEFPAHAETEFRYNAAGLYMAGAAVQIERDGDAFRVSGRRELLTTVLPMVDSVMVRQGAAMIHAATFGYRGAGVAMPAAGGTGKTSTMAKFLRLDGAAFMGDDWAFASGDGRLLGYAKPMFIKPHHKTIYPHLFEGLRKPLVPPGLSGPVSRFTTLVHPMVTQYPRLAGLSRRWSPEHRMVTPRQAFPDATIATEAPLRLAVFVERYDGAEPVMEERTTGWMVSRLIGNFHAEVTRHSQEVMTALGAVGLLPLEETFGLKAEVLKSALAGTPSLVLQVPKRWSADQASDSIVEHLERALGAVGVA